LETRSHSLGRDGLGCLIMLQVTGEVMVLKRQAAVRTPEQAIQLTREKIRDMAIVAGLKVSE
jgi:hypothetical protein